MNLNTFVQTLSIQEREELLNILLEDSNNWTTMPPHIECTTSQPTTTLPPRQDDFTMNKEVAQGKSRKTPVQAKANQWQDTGEDRSIETPEVTRTPRSRSAPRKKDVICHICHKSFSVNASLIYGEFYRCDRCSSSR